MPKAVVSVKKRLYNLDYLRGLAAFSIMLYHLSTWNFGSYSGKSVLGRVGIYGVSIFYILSGLTLYYVYYNKMSPTLSEIGDFFKKRILRIFPLLWLVTVASLVIQRKLPHLSDLLLNFTGLFGFIKWDTYFSTGVWSIGNELVFYVFFPFFVFFHKKMRPVFWFFCVLIFTLFFYFTFFKFSHEMSWQSQWKVYINPLNQVYLFLSGFLVGVFLNTVNIKNRILEVLLILSALLFVFIPSGDNVISIVSGWLRIVFYTCCILICISFYKLKFSLPSFLHKPLTLLGEASYSVYLLHPIIWSIINWGNRHVFKLSPMLNISICIVATLISSNFIYKYFEKYFMKFGRRKAHIYEIQNGTDIESRA